MKRPEIEAFFSSSWSSAWQGVLERSVPKRLRNTAGVWLFGLLRIPLIFFVGPRVLELDDSRCVIEIPLNRRTQNHLRSMYFGALAIGADLAGGLLAQHLSRAYGEGRVGLIFKDFRAEFLKRPEAATRFTCADGEAVRQAVLRAVQTGERQNISVRVVATVPRLSGDEPVADFGLTLSLKVKS